MTTSTLEHALDLARFQIPCFPCKARQVTDDGARLQGRHRPTSGKFAGGLVRIPLTPSSAFRPASSSSCWISICSTPRRGIGLCKQTAAEDQDTPHSVWWPASAVQANARRQQQREQNCAPHVDTRGRGRIYRLVAGPWLQRLSTRTSSPRMPAETVVAALRPAPVKPVSSGGYPLRPK